MFQIFGLQQNALNKFQSDFSMAIQITGIQIF
jgi:hypothetical protein